MSLLGGLKTERAIDNADDAPEAVRAEPVAAANDSAPAKVAELEDGTDWSAFKDSHGGDAPAPKTAEPAPEASVGGVEDVLRSAIQPKSPASSFASAFAGTSTGASSQGGDEGGAGSGASEEGETDPSLDAALNEPAPPVADAEDRYRDLYKGDESLVSMLKTCMDEPEAREMASRLYDLRRDNRDRNARLDMDEAAKRQRLAEMDQEAVHQSGGGILSSLVGKLFGKSGNPALKDLQGIGRERQRLVDEYAGTRDSMRDHMSDFLARSVGERAKNVDQNAIDLTNAVLTYNATLLGTDAAKPVLDALEAHAAETGRPVSELASEIASRKAPKHILDAFDQVKDEVLAKPEVVKAKESMFEMEQKFGDELNEYVDRLDALAKAGDSKPADNYAEALSELEKRIEDMPNPIEVEAKKEEFKKRLRETIESIRAAIEALFKRILQIG